MPHLSYTKDFEGLAGVFLRDAKRYAPLLQFIEAVMVGPSDLSKVEREVIAAHVSKLNGCDFCLGAHIWTLTALDVDFNLIKAIDEGPEAQAIDEKLKPILRFATKLSRTPEEVRQSDIDRLLKAGWTEQAVEDAINVIALFNYVNRLVDALGIEADEPYFKQIGKVLATQGYAPLIETALKRAA